MNGELGYAESDELNSGGLLTIIVKLKLKFNYRNFSYNF